MSYLTDGPIDFRALIERVMRTSDGAVVTFAGIVRDNHAGRAVEWIDYEAYRPMAEQEIEKIVTSVRSDFPQVSINLQHRLGRVTVGEASIGIACASPHRGEAFDACRAAIDRIKVTVPIWKKEKSPDGEVWVGWQS